MYQNYYHLIAIYCSVIISLPLRKHNFRPWSPGLYLYCCHDCFVDYGRLLQNRPAIIVGRPSESNNLIPCGKRTRATGSAFVPIQI